MATPAPPNFTRKPVPVPPPPAADANPYIDPKMLPGEGRPPLPMATVQMSDYTRKQLEKIGWKDGMHIPGDLGQRIQEIQAEVQKERGEAKHDLPPDWTPPRPKLVNIDELPEKHQQELRQYMAEYQQTVAQQAAAESAAMEIESKIPPGTDPQTAAAMRTSLQAAANAKAQRSATGPQMTMIDDGPPPVPAGLPPVPEGKTLGGVSGISPVFAQMEAAKKEAAAPPPPSPEPPPHDHTNEAGAGLTITNCPRCLWNLKLPFDANPTTRDKETYLAAMLGPTRFVKKVPLLGGHASVTFRSLTTAEASMVNKQLGLDLRAGRIREDGEFWGDLMNYRLALSLQQYATDKHTVIDVPTIGEIPYTPNPDEPETPLVPMVKYVNEEVLQTESMRHVVGLAHRQFQRLVETLEAASSDPDFWEGIEPRP